MRRTIIDIIKATILKKNIDNELCLKLMLAMTYIKNNWLIRVFQDGISFYKTYSKEIFNLTHLWILDFIVYILLHEEKRLIKSKKWILRVLKRVLIGYNGHTIYRVHIKDQKKVIWVKNLCIFKDYKIKTSIVLPNYNERSTF